MVAVFDVEPEGCEAAFERLTALGYSEPSLCQRLGLTDLTDFQWRASAIYRQERLHERMPLDLAIDLFFLQGSLEPSEMDQLLTPTEQQALLSCGVLAKDTDRYYATVSLFPVGSELIVSDHANHELGQHPLGAKLHDRVMYIGTDSRWLARATTRRPVQAALDLCCGSGVHALLALKQARQVTAVDINPRAVRCSGFNATLRGATNFEVLLGDLYAPIGARKFDLITANPPFVPAPYQQIGFRDGGPSGEDIQRRIIEGLPQHLSKGGIAQIVTEFGESDTLSIEARIREWLGGARIDFHVLRLRTHSAQAYAIGHARGDSSDELVDSVGRWSTNLKRQGYSRVVSVLLAFQWSEFEPWSRSDEAKPPHVNASSETEAVFLAERLARDPTLLDRLKVSTIARRGPIALFEASSLGVNVAPSRTATLLGQAIAVEHALDPLELDLLRELEHPKATRQVLALTGEAQLPDNVVLLSLVSLIGKGLVTVH